MEFVDAIRIVRAARIFVRRRINSLGHQVPRRLVESAAMVPSPESALERYFRCLLNPKVERRIDLETALVKVLDPVLGPPLDRLADLFREVGADSRRLFFERTP